MPRNLDHSVGRGNKNKVYDEDALNVNSVERQPSNLPEVGNRRQRFFAPEDDANKGKKKRNKSKNRNDEGDPDRKSKKKSRHKKSKKERKSKKGDSVSPDRSKTRTYD